MEVRLYFMDGYEGTSQPGERVFDVRLDGVRVIENLDLTATYGHQIGAMLAFIVTSDGNLDIDFERQVQNPLINAIEVLDTGSDR